MKVYNSTIAKQSKPFRDKYEPRFQFAFIRLIVMHSLLIINKTYNMYENIHAQL